MSSSKQVKTMFGGMASRFVAALVPFIVLAFATPAKATVVYLDPNQTDPCTTTGASGSCLVVQASTQPGGNPNLDWLQLSGSGTALSSEETYTLRFEGTGGSDNSTFPAGVIPVSWDFLITSATAPVSWTVGFTLGMSSDYESFSSSGMANSGAEVSNVGSITFAGSGSIVYYDLYIALSSTAPFTVTVPAGSTEDINPVSGVPEPASWALMAAGGAALALWKRKA